MFLPTLSNKDTALRTLPVFSRDDRLFPVFPQHSLEPRRKLRVFNWRLSCDKDVRQPEHRSLASPHRQSWRKEERRSRELKREEAKMKSIFLAPILAAAHLATVLTE